MSESCIHLFRLIHEKRQGIALSHFFLLLYNACAPGNTQTRVASSPCRYRGLSLSLSLTFGSFACFFFFVYTFLGIQLHVLCAQRLSRCSQQQQNAELNERGYERSGSGLENLGNREARYSNHQPPATKVLRLLVRVPTLCRHVTTEPVPTTGSQWPAALFCLRISETLDLLYLLSCVWRNIARAVLISRRVLTRSFTRDDFWSW